MSVSNGQLANAATFNGAFVSKGTDSTISAKLTQEQESILKEISTPSTPASGYGKIYFKSDGKLYQLNDAGVEVAVGTGSGGGSGAVNFIDNGDAESGTTTGWALYADAAGTSPVDGTGGTANVTNTASSSSPLIGSYSFLLAKDAVNRQGEGWSYAFTIDSAYQAKVLQISFEYLVSSGTFVAGTDSTDSDVTVWIYDVTNAVVIQPSTFKLFSNSSTLSSTFTGSFQAASNSTTYRLLFHVGSTSASAYTLKVDGVSVSPSVYAYGTPVTDWQSYTPTTSGLGTIASVAMYWRRVGGNVEIMGNLTTGTVAASEAQIGLPAGITSSSNISTIQMAGTVLLGASTSSYRNLLIETSKTYMTVGVAATSSQLTKQNGTTFSNSSVLSFQASVPVQGWGASVSMSSDADQRVVVAHVNNSTSNIATTDSLVTFTNIVNDTHGAYSTGTGLFTVPVSGFYRVTSYLTITGLTLSTGQSFASVVYRNGSLAKPLSVLFGNGASNSYRTFGSTVLYCNQGDTLGVYASNGNTTTALTSATVTNNNATFERLSGPSAIAASETVAAKYWATANGTTNTTTPVNFDSKVYDTHNAVTTGASWKFTAPISGKYSLKVYLANNGAVSSGTTDLYKSGAKLESFGYINSTIGAVSSSVTIELNSGDYVDIRQQATYAWLGSVSRSGGGCFIEIERVGN